MDEMKTWLEPLLEKEGCHLYELEWDKSMTPPILRIAIESENGPVDLELCSEISKLISDKLDEIDYADGEYLLEVCSPGIEAKIPLDQLEKNLDAYIHVTTKTAIKGKHDFEGTLQSLKEGEQGEILVLAYFDKGRKARIEIPVNEIKTIRHAVKI